MNETLIPADKRPMDINSLGLWATDHIDAMVAYWDKYLTCRFANAAVRNWYGLSREEMIDRINLKELLGPDYEKIERYVSGVLNGEAQTYEREIVNPKMGVKCSVVNFFPNIVDYKVEGFFVHATDITQLKQLENELILKNELINEQNKRLLNFANIVSHNLRSYSGNLSTVLDLFLNADSEDEKDEMLNYLKTISKRFTNTIDQLDEVVRMQKQGTIKNELINLKEFVERSLEIINIQIKSAKAAIVNNIASDISFHANPAYMESIILNFLTNAIKYRHPDRGLVVELGSYQQGKWVVLTIRDNGIGINLNKYGKDLFGMYKTFHGNSDAHGIGLFITKFQVESMGGRIEVESEEGSGTTFKIFLKSDQ